jgi:hypothetical protein
VRGDIRRGQTGALSFADLYRIFPLGQNPVDGTAGYPLCRFYLFTVEIRAAFELAASTGLINDSFFLSPSGVRVEFDTSREPFDLEDPFNTEKGRVTRITVDLDHSDGVEDQDEVLYDVTRVDPFSGPLGESLTLHPVTTSLYVASFASAAGVTLKDELGNAVTITDTILERDDGSAIKEIDVLLMYLARIGPALPDRYDENTDQGALPRRMICSGPLCP